LFQYLYLFIVKLFEKNNKQITIHIQKYETQFDILNNIEETLIYNKKLLKSELSKNNPQYYDLLAGKKSKWDTIKISSENQINYTDGDIWKICEIIFNENYINIEVTNNINTAKYNNIELDNNNFWTKSEITYKDILNEILRFLFINFLFSNRHNLNEMKMFVINTNINNITGRNYIKFFNECYKEPSNIFKKYFKYKLKYLQLKKII
jgi:hypothetical protein